MWPEVREELSPGGAVVVRSYGWEEHWWGGAMAGRSFGEERRSWAARLRHASGDDDALCGGLLQVDSLEHGLLRCVGIRLREWESDPMLRDDVRAAGIPRSNVPGWTPSWRPR